MTLSPFLRFVLAAGILGTQAVADITNRWSFNNAAGNAPAGTSFVDSIGGATATVVGTGATLNGTAITLTGTTTGNQTPATISGYLDLPNGIISSKPNLTVEAWVTPVSIRSWQRLFDFGRTNLVGNALVQGAGAAPGEILPTATSAPNNTQSSDDLALIINRSTTANTQRISTRLNSAAELTADTGLTINTGTQYHFALVFVDGAGTYGSNGGQVRWYLNGVLATTLDVAFHLSSLEDVNNWIGRSQFSGDSNSNFACNELRLYNHAMSAAEVAASTAAGPNPTFTAPVAVNDAVSMHLGQKARVAVLANDTGIVSGPTVIVVQPPTSGTAVADGTGKILYTHTTGTPASDSFTYRVTGPGGISAPATVTITFSNSLRIANNTFTVPSTPPPLGIQLINAVGGLSSPVCIRTPPGETQRVFICQKGGLLQVVPDITLPVPTFTTFLNLPALLTSRGETISTGSEQGLLSVAFHPNYATNRFFYLFYSVTVSGVVYERVSRFTTQAANPNMADTASELILIQQLDEAGNHNGGDMHFGSDGYLYISVGDEGNQGDSLNNGQTITKDYFSALLRIDVDKKVGSLNPNVHAAVIRDGGVARYAVPPDNPYVGASTFNGVAVAPANVRTEFWAVGFRNPWRFSFDSQTGDLWLGDVGQDTDEEIDIVTRGKNYGWAYREGAVGGSKSNQAPANFDTLYHTPPLYEYVHTGVAGGDSNFKGNSVTGGVVYRGSRFPSLQGLYIFSDYQSGHIWTLARNGTNPPTVTRIAGEVGIVAFGTDPSNGDVLLADLDGGRILRLTVETPIGTFPDTLSATGLFADLTDLAPSPGVLPYTVNLPFWSDYAIKSRWFTIPTGSSTMTWSRDGLWDFPAGQIWVKHFDLETTRGNPATKKRIETRLIVKNAGGAYGVSYRWNDAGTEAALVSDAGADFNVGITVNGTPYSQHYRIPSRSECLACHTPQAGHALSFNTRQLNLGNVINGFPGNQLSVLQGAGYFSNVPESPNVLPRHLRPEETTYPVEARVRSYLAVNCAYCHKAGGTAAPAVWDGRPELTLDSTGLINGNATNNGGDPANKLVVPGDTAHSIVLNRIAVTNGFTRMPPLASSELDQANIALVTDWIVNALPGRQTYAAWRLEKFGSSVSPEGEPTADPDGDGLNNNGEFLAQTSPLNGGSFLSTQLATGGGMVTMSFNVPANRSALIETTTDFATWALWDVPGNNGLPQAGGATNVTGPMLGANQFFRLRLQEN
jgi:uncharacterized repeat protein (TIGR03806 family)